MSEFFSTASEQWAQPFIPSPIAAEEARPPKIIFQGRAIALSDELPEAVRQRLKTLLSISDNLRAPLPMLAQKADEIADRCQALERQIGQKQSSIDKSGIVAKVAGKLDREIAGWKRELKDLSAELETIKAQHGRDEGRFSAVGNTLIAIARFLTETTQSRNEGDPLPFALAKPVATKTGLDLAGARAAVDAMKAERTAIIAAPRPVEEAMKIATRQIDDLITKGAPSVTRLLHPGTDNILWPAMSVQTSTAIGFEATFTNAGPIAGMMAWLDRDAVLAAISRDLEAAAKGNAPIASADRKAGVTRLDHAILTAERAEAELSFQAGDFRPSINPMAVLNVETISA